MSEKGATSTDKAAHMVMDFIPNPANTGVTSKYGYIAFYHEERLFSVRNMDTGIVSLVYASSPVEAIEKVQCACEKEIMCVRKNTKQKPKRSDSGMFYICPCCNRFINRHERAYGNIDIRHCKWCGQALDWSDKDG